MLKLLPLGTQLTATVLELREVVDSVEKRAKGNQVSLFVSVTKVQEAVDLGDIVTLLNELDLFYGDEVTESKQERTAHVGLALLGEPPSSHAIIARASAGEPIGFAAYSFLWPAAGSTRSLFLKELYVTQAQRRNGIGHTLMQRIFEIASNESCSRVEWTTEAANVEARRFYEKIGASLRSDKVFYRYEPTSAKHN